jgi:hypothetical protein
MIRVRDYSLLAEGFKIDDGEIKICTHCGKRGLATEVNGKTFYTHMQEWGWDENGKPVINWAFCPK